MSDADNQMGGHGGDTGKDPADQTDEAPDPVTGNMGDEDDEETPPDLPVDGQPQGEKQASVNREDDPPA